MKIVVIGGTGLIGSKTVPILRQGGHEVVAASPKTGVDILTGEGLKDAMAGTSVVIDLANSPSFEDKAVLEFFQTSGRNLLAAEAAAGVGHHVALSIVGTDRSPDNGYFRAKVVQERLIESSGLPYTIVRSTQFLEFLGAIADSGAQGSLVRLSPGPVPAHRGGRRCTHCRRCGAWGAPKRHSRHRRPGTSAIQRNRLPLSESGRRPAKGR
ncbi:MAG TPA: NAD(P)H-binding protein [Candidatus Binataceae bacterium]